MRRHRRIDAGYRSGPKKKSKKKLILRILFVIACAAALTAIAVFIGSRLNEKAKFAETLPRETAGDVLPVTDTAELYPDGIPSGSDASGIEICAADIDVRGLANKESYNTIDSLSPKYNALSVRITENGSLVYSSPALMDFIGIRTDAPSAPDTVGTDEENGEPEVTENNVFANIKAVVQMADAKGLRLSAIYTTDRAVLGDGDASVIALSKDKVILGELVSLGFDEVIIDGLANETEELTHDELRRIISYLARLRESSGDLDIGVTLPASVYLIPQTASKIKTLSEYADFLAIGISSNADDPETAFSLVYDNCYSLKGNFSVYNLRGIIRDTDPEMAEAVFAALRTLSVPSVQFTVFVEDPSFDPERGTDSTSPETWEEPVNDNAMRADDYTAVYDEEYTEETY
ncbi:MAG: hypothetical protein MJ096_01120 [Clostridia bacterium]|nr:hypothetical protein [Clostridia bacterium]